MDILHFRNTGCFALRVGNMGTDNKDGKVPRQFSVQGRVEDHGEAAAAQEGRDLLLPLIGRSNERGSNRSDMDVNPQEAEYGHAIYCDAADSGPV